MEDVDGVTGGVGWEEEDSGRQPLSDVTLASRTHGTSG